MSRSPAAMKTMLLVGSVGSGKTTFRQRLQDEDIEYVKTQSLEAFDGVIDTPGEYLEHGRLQRALQVASWDVDLVVLMLDPSAGDSRIPPGFAAAFNREVIGVVTKTDLVSEDEIRNAREHLLRAGAHTVVAVDSLSGSGFSHVRGLLCR